MDQHAPGEGMHAERVAVYAVATGHALGWNERDLLTLRWAAALHDVGKIALSQELLQKKGALLDSEREQLKQHTSTSSGVLDSLEWLGDALAMVLSHHERWDGGGYPQGLSGNQIPEGARIIAVCETFDALTWPSPLRDPMEEAAAIAEIRRCAGTQFDPAVVNAFCTVQPLIQPASL